jgi:hypothetical protein
LIIRRNLAAEDLLYEWKAREIHVIAAFQNSEFIPKVKGGVACLLGNLEKIQLV